MGYTDRQVSAGEGGVFGQGPVGQGAGQTLAVMPELSSAGGE